MFVCPVCRGELTSRDATLACPDGHAFDVAKEGYVNLLTPQHRHSKDPGYSQSMIASRRDFFDAGHYEPLADQLAAIVLDHLDPPADRPLTILDAGCGEGYYLRRLRAAAAGVLELCGVDVSKHGIRIAAKRDPLGRYAVASTHDLPLPDTSFDAVLTHFSPIFPESFRRVLRPGGIFVVGGPGPDHLFGLKQLVYDDPQRHEVPEPLASDGFTAIGEHRISYPLSLRSATDVANLLSMTPFYWSASIARQQQLAALDTLDTPIDVHVAVYRV